MAHGKGSMLPCLLSRAASNLTVTNAGSADTAAGDENDQIGQKHWVDGVGLKFNLLLAFQLAYVNWLGWAYTLWRRGLGQNGMQANCQHINCSHGVEV